MLEIYRFQDWWYLLGLPILGYFSVTKEINLSGLIPLVVIASFYLAYGYSLNEFSDRKKDILENKSAVFFKELSFPIGAFIVGALLLFLFAFNRREAWLVYLTGGIAGYLYSAAPLRFKGRPFLGLIFNALCFAPLFLLGASFVRGIDAFAFLFSLFIFIFFIPIQIIHEIAHYEFDKADNIKTTVCFLGLQRSKVMLMASSAITLLYLLLISRVYRLYPFFAMTGIFLFCINIMAIGFIDRGWRENLKKITRVLSLIYGAGLFLFVYFRHI